ncbi:MAG: NAD(+)/NADH kinase [Ruminococcus sp.]|nr:NAD(+)/NADH kinase [Ruminococcus sp.]
MKIGLLVNLDKKRAIEVAQQIVAILTEGGAEVLTDKSCPLNNTTVADTAEDVIRACDIAVTVGGDGTIIHNAKFAALYNKPLLGVNLGRIGFVANIEPDELDELQRLLTGDYRIQRRMLLEITKTRGNDSVTYTAVNEAVIHRDSLSSMVDISVEDGFERIVNYRADGMLFATPTGSTAYSFSAGGPVIEPDMRCILLTPVCPHALSSRQVVFGENAVLTARVQKHSDLKCYMTVDGQNYVPVSSDDTVTVKRSPMELQLIILKEKNFYTLLNEKLKENS